jgi:peroxiredoxin
MAKKKYRKNNDAAMFIVGGGLVLFAIALIVFLAQGNSQAGASTGASLSTIPVEVNYPAPELTLENVNGKTESLTDYSGKVVLVNNWATWCPPCKAEMPDLKAYYEAHKDEGFTIVAISAADAEADVRAFVEQYELSFSIWLDPQNEALAAFRNQSLPSSYVVDRTGVVRLAWTGGITRDILEEHLTPLLEEKAHGS